LRSRRASNVEKSLVTVADVLREELPSVVREQEVGETVAYRVPRVAAHRRLEREAGVLPDASRDEEADSGSCSVPCAKSVVGTELPVLARVAVGGVLAPNVGSHR
jgi:hypothetical protein